MAGVTEQGFVTKRLPDILLELQDEARRLFQDLTPPGDTVDISPSSALGRLIGLVSPSAVDGWDAAQQVYTAFDANASTGIPLDNLVAFSGITRQEKTFTTTPLLFYGDTNTLIPSGSVVSSPTTAERFNISTPVALVASIASGVGVTTLVVADSTLYTITYTSSTTTQNINYTSGVSGTTLLSVLSGLKGIIDASHPSLTGTVVGTTLNVMRNDVFQTVAFTTSINIGIIKVSTVGEGIAENVGPLTQLAGTITEISTPVLGWDTVNNTVSASPGRLEETDGELRLRFRNSKFLRASNSIDSLYSALLEVSSVQDVVIYENDTNITDGNGVPGHSFLTLVVGGLSTDIAQAIWDNRPVGILSFGNTSVSINDIQGFPHTISFSRPDGVLIYISMNLTTNSEFPANGVDLIKQTIVDYFQNTFTVGDDVVYSRLYTPINSIPGHEVNSLTIGITPAPVGLVNIPIAFDKIASINDLNISITI